MAEGTSDMVEVPSEHDSGCDLDDNLYLHFYSIQKKRNFWKAKWVKERAKWVANGKSKRGSAHFAQILLSKFCQGLVLLSTCTECIHIATRSSTYSNFRSQNVPEGRLHKSAVVNIKQLDNRLSNQLKKNI